MQHLLPVFLRLISSDLMDSYEAFDLLLFDENRETNQHIIEALQHFKNEPELICQLIQLLSFRASNYRREFTRAQTDLEQEDIVHALLECARSQYSIVRKEICLALEEIAEAPTKTQLKFLQKHNLPYVSASETLCCAIQDFLETFQYELDQEVKEQKQTTLKAVETNHMQAVQDKDSNIQKEERVTK